MNICKMLNEQPETPSIKGDSLLTTRGLLPISQLKRRVGMYDDAGEHVDWVEFYADDGAMIHRSAHVTIKNSSVNSAAIAGNIG